jgi:hypothetical protein
MREGVVGRWKGSIGEMGDRWFSKAVPFLLCFEMPCGSVSVHIPASVGFSRHLSCFMSDS